MEWGYAAADIVISRAGAMAVAELCVVKKPVVFVPYPFAAEDHQTANARNLVDKGAAVMVADSEVKQKLVPLVLELVGDGGKREELTNNIGQQGVSDADTYIAKEIFNSI
ncbi:MAG TPA: glycosyltransferase, partial [Flavisolibacter sp.]|nr:glycosyltransferase [Flavisolibacter sp.]